MTFPIEVLKDTKSACCFFSAGFLGRNDVAYIRDAGLTDVTLIDIDEAKLTEMHDLYPPTWEYMIKDAWEAARTLRSEHRHFDIVTVDPWTGDIDRALFALPLWLSLTRHFLVIGICKDWFINKRREASLDGFNGWRSNMHWNGECFPPRSVSMTKRSDFRGGVYWLIFDVRNDGAVAQRQSAEGLGPREVGGSTPSRSPNHDER